MCLGRPPRLVALVEKPQEPRGNTCHDCPSRYIFSDDRPSAHDGLLPDCHIGQDDCASPNPASLPTTIRPRSGVTYSGEIRELLGSEEVTNVTRGATDNLSDDDIFAQVHSFTDLKPARPEQSDSHTAAGSVFREGFENSL